MVWRSPIWRPPWGVDRLEMAFTSLGDRFQMALRSLLDRFEIAFGWCHVRALAMHIDFTWFAKPLAVDNIMIWSRAESLPSLVRSLWLNVVPPRAHMRC